MATGMSTNLLLVADFGITTDVVWWWQRFTLHSQLSENGDLFQTRGCSKTGADPEYQKKGTAIFLSGLLPAD